MMPKPGDIVAVTMSGEVFESCDGAPGYVWVRVPGHGPIIVPVGWVRVVRESGR